MYIPKRIKKEIEEFCILNDIEGIDKFILKTIETGFNIEKYGNAPFIKEVIVEKEVPVEVIKEVIVEKEVPVEVIKEVIKEIPIEKKVIEEVIVEKKVYVSDDKKVNELSDINNELAGRIKNKNQKIKDLEFNIKKKEKENDIKITEYLDQELIIKNKESLIDKKDKKIKELNKKIKDLEKEKTTLSNQSNAHPNARPIRDIYDEDENKGGHWGSNLNDKK